MKLKMLLCLFALPLAALGSLKIEFESPEYRPGQRLWGQGAESARWQGTAEPLFSVERGVGVNGSNGVRVTKRNRDFDAALLRPSADVHFPRFNPESSVVVYRLSVQMEDLGADGICSRIRFADGAVQLELYNNGGLFFMDGSTPGQMHRTARTATRQNFQAKPGEFFTLEATVDYGSRTYDLKVNGVPQNDGNPVGMRVTEQTPGRAIDVWIAAWLQTNDAWQNFVFDNLQIELVRP